MPGLRRLSPNHPAGSFFDNASRSCDQADNHGEKHTDNKPQSTETTFVAGLGAPFHEVFLTEQEWYKAAASERRAAGLS
jgi:hypothetical protein